MRRRDTILLTGFGPFPGVDENASERFVPKLAHLAARRFSAHRVVARILPTEWERGPARLATLYQARAAQARASFRRVGERDVLRRGDARLATHAPNPKTRPARCRAIPCSRGTAPKHAKWRSPAADIVARLAALSDSGDDVRRCGLYLCNAVLYRSLELAEEQEIDGVGFFHIPRVIPPALLKSKTERREMRFDWSSALLGGLEIIRTCLGRPPPSRRHVKFL